MEIIQCQPNEDYEHAEDLLRKCLGFIDDEVDTMGQAEGKAPSSMNPEDDIEISDEFRSEVYTSLIRELIHAGHATKQDFLDMESMLNINRHTGMIVDALDPLVHTDWKSLLDWADMLIQNDQPEPIAIGKTIKGLLQVMTIIAKDRPEHLKNG